MHTVGHVVALPPNRDEVDPIRADLRSAGVHSVIRAATPGTYTLEDTSMHEHVLAARRGTLVGAAIGAIVGVILLMAFEDLRGLPVLGQVVLVAGIAIQGTFPVIMWRMGGSDHYDDVPAVTRDLADEDQLVIVDAEHEEQRVRRILERHHATFLTEGPAQTTP